MNSVWILQIDYSPHLKAYESEDIAIDKYLKHIESRMPELEDDEEHTEYYDEEHRGCRHRSCYYDGSFVASLTQVKVEK